ncbi:MULTISPECIES: autotransporter outer membrane beta-barrel domain-containing protein [Citrobacter]|uniref:Autotransporter outer membrane beta-barrel domain-containing protein n=1 Tax=Citrobacter telavivensis TaxID=2653932 RepID=A0A6L5EDG7_9ENTR|nr:MULTISPECIES: autotransporter outer membrane beta-barrel domain-containing protein [Citrobacter]MPQ53527.1 autotransporter outer membrane beta-barrel domain-containing protein [Citrobacter telavivensis]QFS71931.1 autotransporter outer membrane beta-barrel domain-containing protein [Citrobacter telavivensis]
MNIKKSHQPKSILAIAIAFAIQTAAAANVDNINLLTVTPPTDITSDLIIDNNDSLTLSSTENTGSNWNQVRAASVGSTGVGTLIIDGRDILVAEGAIIGYGGTGIVTLTNGATWRTNNWHIQLGMGNGSGTLNVLNGSKITGLDDLRIGEAYEDAQGVVNIDGANSSIETSWTVVGDQGHGQLFITNGGKLSTTSHMSIGLVGVTVNTDAKGFGETRVDGANSMLDVAAAINLGGFSTVNNTAKGILTVSNGATVKSGTLIRLAYGNGSTGILNIGGAQGETEQAAGNIEASRIYLMNNSDQNTAILNFNHSSQDFVLASRIYGNGEVNHVGSGVTTLTGANTYSGNTLVSRGTLRAGAENTFSDASDYIVNDGASLDLNGYSQTLNSLALAGTTTLSSPPRVKAAFSPTTLTINGNYTGNNGLLALRTVLGDDLSATDKLVVRGDTSGTTRVSVSNAGGGGSQTVEGIPVVEVEGASNGTFVKEGRIVAGAYDYNIIKKNNQNWHLTSEVIPDPLPPDEPAPASPEQPVPETPAAPEGKHQYRPETGSYLANTLAANTLFTTRLHDRLGETQYTDALTGEQKVTSLWMRHIGGHNRFKDGSGQISTQSNRYVLQLGGDIAQWSTDGLDRWHLGLMAGYANSKSRSHSSLTGYTSRGEISGYSAGLYGTWYANDADKTGAYVDGWMLYNWFDNTVSGQGLASEEYDSDGITASVETGYTWKLAEFSERNALYIQPKVQVTWMDVQADTHIEKNGTRVVDKTDGNLQTRLGVKAYLQGHNAMDDGKDRTFQPFVEANWIHNTQNYSVQMDDINSEVKGSRNIAELKAGVEGQLTKNVTLWGNVAQQIGDNGYSDTQGMLGLKYSF